jgi:hypothetical protein
MKFKLIIIGIIMISCVFCHSDSSDKYYTDNEKNNGVKKTNIHVFRNICGNYMGVIKSSTDQSYYSIKITLFPNSTFDVYKKKIEGNLSTNRMKGTFSINHDTLILHHVIDSKKFLLNGNEIHYIPEYNPTDVNFLKKDVKSILYKLN